MNTTHTSSSVTIPFLIFPMRIASAETGQGHEKGKEKVDQDDAENLDIVQHDG